MSEENKPLKWALEYAAAGYRVFPLKAGTKVPATRNGLHDASSDPSRVADLFSGRCDFNIGLACGPQANGTNLLAIDVDAGKGGLETWDALPDVDDAPIHLTPNGGLHVFFDAPGFRNTRNRLGAGIDTRAEGGYVVVPPSLLDEGKTYRATGATALLTNEPPSAPVWLLQALGEGQVQTHQLTEREPARRLDTEDETPGDYVRRTGDFPAALHRAGWTHAGGEYWTRPGKSVRDGHSAVLHDSGPLVVFTTDIPPELERLGTPTADRTGVSVSLFDFITVYEFGGDRSLAARSVRAAMPAPPRGRVVGATRDGADTGSDPGERAGSSTTVLNLPAEFWESRPELRLIRDAAHNRLVSPDALLCNSLARSAALIPPSLKLPPIIGTDATFDFLGCVVAETSGGKSITAGVAKDLQPDPGRDLHADERVYMFDMPIGSGEGIAQAFMVPERKIDEDGKDKLTGRQVVGKQALHFVVDESTGLVAQAQRKGTTIIPTLLSAWSGQTLGQLNASAETRRIVEGGRCRVSAVLNMQSSNAWMLFTEEMTTLGLTSRMLFSWAHDPSSPDELPPWPGELTWEIPPKLGMGQEYMAYDQDIIDQIVSERRAVLRGGVTDKSTGHSSLLRCKVAAILAVWQGRRLVTGDDWSLAGQVVSISAGVLSMLNDLRRQQEGARRTAAAVARGDSEYVAETAKEKRAITDLSNRILARVPEEGIGRAELRRTLTSGKTRHRFEAALEAAVASGYLAEVDGRLLKQG